MEYRRVLKEKTQSLFDANHKKVEYEKMAALRGLFVSTIGAKMYDNDDVERR